MSRATFQTKNKELKREPEPIIIWPFTLLCVFSCFVSVAITEEKNEKQIRGQNTHESNKNNSISAVNVMLHSQFRMVNSDDWFRRVHLDSLSCLIQSTFDPIRPLSIRPSYSTQAFSNNSSFFVIFFVVVDVVAAAILPVLIRSFNGAVGRSCFFY